MAGELTAGAGAFLQEFGRGLTQLNIAQQKEREKIALQEQQARVDAFQSEMKLFETTSHLLDDREAPIVLSNIVKKYPDLVPNAPDISMSQHIDESTRIFLDSSGNVIGAQDFSRLGKLQFGNLGQVQFKTPVQKPAPGKPLTTQQEISFQDKIGKDQVEVENLAAQLEKLLDTQDAIKAGGKIKVDKRGNLELVKDPREGLPEEPTGGESSRKRKIRERAFPPDKRVQKAIERISKQMEIVKNRIRRREKALERSERLKRQTTNIQTGIQGKPLMPMTRAEAEKLRMDANGDPELMKRLARERGFDLESPLVD